MHSAENARGASALLRRILTFQKITSLIDLHTLTLRMQWDSHKVYFPDLPKSYEQVRYFSLR